MRALSIAAIATLVIASSPVNAKNLFQYALENSSSTLEQIEYQANADEPKDEAIEWKDMSWVFDIQSKNFCKKNTDDEFERNECKAKLKKLKKAARQFRKKKYVYVAEGRAVFKDFNFKRGKYPYKIVPVGGLSLTSRNEICMNAVAVNATCLFFRKPGVKVHVDRMNLVGKNVIMEKYNFFKTRNVRGFSHKMEKEVAKEFARDEKKEGIDAKVFFTWDGNTRRCSKRWMRVWKHQARDVGMKYLTDYCWGGVKVLEIELDWPDYAAPTHIAE